MGADVSRNPWASQRCPAGPALALWKCREGGGGRRGCRGRAAGPLGAGDDDRLAAARAHPPALHLSLFGLEFSLLWCEDVSRIVVADREPESHRVALPFRKGRYGGLSGTERQDDLEEAEPAIDQRRQPQLPPGRSHDTLGRCTVRF